MRRAAQIINLRPDLKIEGLRGNIDTRIARCLKGDFDAVILAMAGVRRSGLLDDATMIPIPTDQLTPAAAQGALALQCRGGDSATRQILQALDDPNTKSRYVELGSTAPKPEDRGPAGAQKLVASEVARILRMI